MNTIWKYRLNIEDKQTIELPVGCRLLKIDYVTDIACGLYEKFNDLSVIPKLPFNIMIVPIDELWPGITSYKNKLDQIGTIN